MKFKLIIGLGNTGPDYTNTRHNAGFLFVEALASSINPSHNWKGDSKLEADICVLHTGDGKIILVKPTTFMNNSGRAVQKVMSYYQINPEETLLAYDDLDLELGNFKLQQGKFPKVHNGLSSVKQHVDVTDMWHLRLGIDNREQKGNKGIPGMKYTLERFKSQELEIFSETLSEAIAEVNS